MLTEQWEFTMKKQTGYTLIEIMIALLLGLIVVAATITIYITTIRGSSDIAKSARLNHDLESAMSLMVNDIRRAGYWGGAVVGADSRANPFTSETTNVTNIQIRNLTAPTTAVITGTGDCILYSYDADGDGVVGANEYYGFRRNGNTINMRFSVTAPDDPTDCSKGSWEENIAGDQITITTLTFNLDSSKCLNVTTGISTDTVSTACTGASSGNNLAEKRLVNIQLAGKLKNDDTVIKTLNGTIEVRNNRLLTQP